MKVIRGFWYYYNDKTGIWQGLKDNATIYISVREAAIVMGNNHLVDKSISIIPYDDKPE